MPSSYFSLLTLWLLHHVEIYPQTVKQIFCCSYQTSSQCICKWNIFFFAYLNNFTQTKAIISVLKCENEELLFLSFKVSFYIFLLFYDYSFTPVPVKGSLRSALCLSSSIHLRILSTIQSNLSLHVFFLILIPLKSTPSPIPLACLHIYFIHNNFS